jgi:DNA repair exonuclease SbcCD nuclease subunit
MTRIAVAADLHLRLSGPRAAECERCMAWLRDDLVAQRPDLIVIAGDFYHQRATPAEERFAQRWLQSVSLGLYADTGRQIPILLVRGNHDDADQLLVLGETRAAPGQKPNWAPIHAVTHPEGRGCGEASVALIPWPNLGALAAAMGPGASIADRREAARAALTDILRGFQLLKPSAPLLLIAHANILGAAQDSGQPVCGGDELALSVGDLLEARPGAIVCGHIHAGQAMEAPVPCWYTGSLFRQTFGEASGVKGYVVAEWTGGDRWALTRRESPARRMLLVSSTWSDGHLDGDEVDPEECQDAEIRLRVEFQSDEREAARAAAAGVKRTLEEAGAFSVIVEECPVVVSRTRCSEITAARTTTEKLQAWAQATTLDVPEGAAGKLAQLEGEVQS